VFKETIDLCGEILAANDGIDIGGLLYAAGPPEPAATNEGIFAKLARGEQKAGPEDDPIGSATAVQPAVFAVEYALARLMISRGYRPAAMIGYSLGEYVAACIAGVFSVEDALRLVMRRAQLIESRPRSVMLAACLSAHDAERYLRDGVEVAIDNGPSLCVLTGKPEPVATVEAELSRDRIVARRVRNSHPVHSSLMDPIVADLVEAVGSATLSAPSVPMVSNVTGNWLSKGEALDAAYWGRHLVSTVRFADGIRLACGDRPVTLVEVGPGQTLGLLAHQCLDLERGGVTTCSLLRDSCDAQADDVSVLDKAIARLEEAPPHEARTAPEKRRGGDIETALREIWRDILKIDEVGDDDGFIELGGESLQAMMIAHRINARFGAPISVGTVLSALTVPTLAEEIRRHPQQDCTSGGNAIGKRHAGRRVFPLSHGQQGLWFLEQLEPGNHAYNLVICSEINGRPDRALLQQSIAELARRQESLRTSFASAEGAPIQVVVQQVDARLEEVDLSAVPPAARAAELEEALTRRAEDPFDLRVAPLWRATLFLLSPHESVLLIVMHHIISDGWSKGVVLRELLTIYESLAGDGEPVLPPIPMQYTDYVAWQRNRLEGEEREPLLDYWRRQLAGAPPAIDLPLDLPRPPMQTFSGNTIAFEIPRALRERCGEFSRREGVTPFMTLLSAFALVLHRCSGQDDIVIGVPTACRTLVDIENLVGLFVNTLALRLDLSGNPTFGELVGRTRGIALDAYSHQEMPFAKLVEALAPARDMSRNPVYQVLFNMHANAWLPTRCSELTFTPRGVRRNTAILDLSMSIRQTGPSWHGELEYNTDLFENSTARRLTSQYLSVLKSVVDDAAQRIDG
jgi:malonyl CoA-acyl carrier protein transacylase